MTTGLRAVSLVSIALVASSCVTRARFEESEAGHRAAQQEIARLHEQRDALEERLQALETKYQRLDSRSEVLEEMIGTLRQLNACIRHLQLEVERAPSSDD